ncbi:hypothetical protein D3C87_1746220 [compost metagenome]
MTTAATAVTRHQQSFRDPAGDDDGNASLGTALHRHSDARIGVAGAKCGKHDPIRTGLQARLDMGGITTGINGNDINPQIGEGRSKLQRCGMGRRPRRAERIRRIRAQLVQPPCRQTSATEG